MLSRRRRSYLSFREPIDFSILGQTPESEYNTDRMLHSFYNVVGQHGIIYGATGTGKTNTELNFLYQFYKRGEICIWNDLGKTRADKGNISETLAITMFAPVKFLHPKGTIFKIESKEELNYPYEICEFEDIYDLFDQIDPKYVTVISATKYIRDAVPRTEWLTDFFDELKDRAYRKRLPHQKKKNAGMAWFCDEIHKIVPPKREVLFPEQYRLINAIVDTVEELRGLGVRVIATCHGITRIDKLIRQQFNWVFFKRLNEKVWVDCERLKMCQRIIASLPPEWMIVLYPDKVYSEPVGKIPLIKIPRGFIHYGGRYEYKKVGLRLESRQKHAIITRLKEINPNIRNSEIAEALDISPREVRYYLEEDEEPAI